MCNMFKNYDPCLESHLKLFTIFEELTFTTKQNDVIKAVSDIVKNKIKEESNQATFVSLMLDETSGIQCKSQLSTVLHYIHESKTCEWFWGFTDSNADRTSGVLFSHAQHIN